MQGGEGATVRWCVIGAIGAAVGATVRSVRRWDRYNGVARLIYFRFYFLLEQRERNRAENGRRGWGCLGVAGGVAGGGSGRQRAESREQRAESEKRDREVKWSKSSTRVLENGLRKFFP